jgi:muramoyltetrapeptide carboxypeptidase
MASKRQMLPRPLRLGDTLAVIRPCSRLDEEVYRTTLEALRQRGWAVAEFSSSKTRPKLWRSDSFFAADDRSRAQEFAWAMNEPGIKAVLVARGGYGSARMLRALTNQERRRPRQAKWVVGYSDVTYLHQWLWNQWGWSGVHGPLIGRVAPSEINRVLESLTAPEKSLALKNAKIVQKGGVARGRLVGGNLSLIQAAGPAQLPQEPLVLMIEEVNEDFYRIDRMLGQLLDAGYDRWIKAVLLGTFLECGKNDKKTFGWKKVEETLKSLCSGPILSQVRFGHGLKSQSLFHLGRAVELRGKNLRYREALCQ